MKHARVVGILVAVLLFAFYWFGGLGLFVDRTAVAAFSYDVGDKAYSVIKSHSYPVADLIRTEEWGEIGSECNPTHTAKFYTALLKQFRPYDRATTHLATDPVTNASWFITTVPNRLGYTTDAEFQADFAVCSAGAPQYPLRRSITTLIFVSSCGSGAAITDDAARLSEGCTALQQQIEPTIVPK